MYPFCLSRQLLLRLSTCIYLNTVQVPDYHEYIKTPMDLSTIQDKVNELKYDNLDEFQDDITLMIKNCMTYNAKETPFYKSALRMSDQVGWHDDDVKLCTC